MSTEGQATSPEPSDQAISGEVSGAQHFTSLELFNIFLTANMQHTSTPGHLLHPLAAYYKDVLDDKDFSSSVLIPAHSSLALNSRLTSLLKAHWDLVQQVSCANKTFEGLLQERSCLQEDLEIKYAELYAWTGDRDRLFKRYVDQDPDIDVEILDYVQEELLRHSNSVLRIIAHGEDSLMQRWNEQVNHMALIVLKFYILEGACQAAGPPEQDLKLPYPASLRKLSILHLSIDRSDEQDEENHLEVYDYWENEFCPMLESWIDELHHPESVSRFLSLFLFERMSWSWEWKPSGGSWGVHVFCTVGGYRPGE